MATSRETIDWLGERLAGSGAVFRKMFGEYCVYLDGKICAMVCDNRFLVKITPGSREALWGAPEEPPYPGARSMLLVEELDDGDRLAALLRRVAAELPQPPPKR